MTTPIRTYVLDNGQEYSAHSLYFVETAAPLAVMEEAVTFMNHSIVGIVEGSIAWRASGGSTSLAEYVSPYDIWGHDDSRGQPQMRSAHVRFITRKQSQYEGKPPPTLVIGWCLAHQREKWFSAVPDWWSPVVRSNLRSLVLAHFTVMP